MKKRQIKHFKSKKIVVANLALLATTTGLAYANPAKADVTDSQASDQQTANTQAAQAKQTQAVQSTDTQAKQTAADKTKTADTATDRKTSADTAKTTAATTTATTTTKTTANTVQTKTSAVTATKAATTTTTTTTATKSAFKTTSGKTYYYDANGQVVKNQVFTVKGKQYYADANGQIAKSTTKKVNGITATFDNTGAISNNLDFGQLLRDQIEFSAASKLKKAVKYDWTETKNKYQESATHEMAQLLAQGDVKNDNDLIATLMENNSSMSGKVLASLTLNVGQSGASASQVAAALVSKLGNADATGSVIGAGYYNGVASALIYKVEEVKKAAEAVSKIDPSVSAVYSDAGKVTNPVTSKMSDEDAKTLTDGVSSALLKGKAGTAISQEVLQTIFAGLAGDQTAFEGSSLYYDANGKAYHYQYWLSGKDSAEKLANFLKANTGVKYGDALKAVYTATLIAGTGTNADAVDETPTSKKTADEITAAYQTGSETGLKYESVKVEKIPGMTDDMIRGVDISTYQALVNAGVKFYDFNGKEASLIKVLADAGVNWVRLRIWNDPYNADGMGYGGGNTDEASVIKMASEAKKYGMKVLLDFHYSDFWVDPAKQILPKAWKDLSVNALDESIKLYTEKVLTDLRNAGASADMVQVGNEITNGAFGLYTDRDHGGNWETLWKSADGDRVAEYLATAAKAVRNAAPQAKIALQLETPNIYKYRTIMTVFKKHGIDYDYLGTSYYPFWSTGNDNGTYNGQSLGKGANTPNNLLAVEKMAKEEFGKTTVILETGWLNNLNDSDGTGNSIGQMPTMPEGVSYMADPQGQVNAMADMYKAIIAGGSVGAFYWEPAQIAVKAGWNNWNYNKEMSNVYGTGWASKYAIGYAPENVMYYKGKETWGGSTWDNVALFDDHGYPLQSLMMYKGFLTGYESAENTASTVTPKLAALYGADQASLKAENQLHVGQDLTLTNYLDGAVSKYLNGVKGTKISEASLKSIFAGLTDGLKSDQFKDEAGNNYHYEYWLEGSNADEKLANFLKSNVGATYGSPITVNYTATLVKDEKVIEKATSTVEATATTVWGLDNVTIDSPMTVGQKLSAEDTALIEKAAAQYLTGEKGTEISADSFAKIAEAINAGIASSKEYQVKFTDATSVYHYVYYLDGADLAALNKGAKYGDPIKINVSASLKWVKNL